MKLVRILAVLGLAFAAGACERTAPAPEATEVDITMRRMGDGVWRLSYRLSAPADALRFGRPVGDFRARDWTIETPGARFVADEDGERIVAKQGRLEALEITVRETAMTVEKNYQPFYPFSDGGVLLYTGHFNPDLMRGGEAAAAVKHFEFISRPGKSVLVFGERRASVDYDASDNAHPFFVYFGSRPAIETGDVAAIVDPDIPDWIDHTFQAFIPQIFDYYRSAFGTALPRTPNFFLASDLADAQSGYSFTGDALPGQFQVTLAGDGWRTPSETGFDLLAFHTAHEAAHLWQNLTQPVDSDQPEWIHEGGADAVAAEALVALGLWTNQRAGESFEKASKTCAHSLEGGALSAAQKRGDYKALYACGRVMAVAAARAEGEGATVAAFWATFIARARAEGGYSEALYFALVEERAGRPDFARALRRFVQTPFAEPDKEIAGLLVLADAVADEEPFPLEPDAAH